MKKKAVFNWSGGKDSAHALWKVMQSDEYEIIALLTTVNGSTNLSTMHNIPVELLKVQSEHIGIPLEVVKLKPAGTMLDYNEAMRQAVESFQAKGVSSFIYGDIFLDDIRSYREQQLSPYGIEVVEPLWGKTSQEIIESFLRTGLETVVVTTMENGLGKEAIGRRINRDFINSLPPDCDPNGENGEYHTFCYGGPIYTSPIRFSLGKPFKKSFDIRMEDGKMQTYSYWFVDLHNENE